MKPLVYYKGKPWSIEAEDGEFYTLSRNCHDGKQYKRVWRHEVEFLFEGNG